jgi:hypothetical protein
MDRDEILVEYMNEHYAHARDHESLRAQITSILCAAAFVLIGLSIDKNADSRVMIGVGIVAMALAALNYRLNEIHKGRFDAHVGVAGGILKDMENRLWRGSGGAIKPSEARKKFWKEGASLSRTWNFVPLLVGITGLLVAGKGIIELVASKH